MVIHLIDGLRATFRSIEAVASRSESPLAFETGFERLDRLCGLRRGELTILGGAPSVGKTALAISLMLREGLATGVGQTPPQGTAGQGAQDPSASNGDPEGEQVAEAQPGVLFFSYELPVRALVGRMLAVEARVDASKIPRAWLTEADWTRLVQAASYFGTLPFWLECDPTIDIEGLRARASEIAAAHSELRLIIVDYVQQMPGILTSSTRDQQIGEITRGLKAIAKQHDIAVLALSQLNRNGNARETWRPLLSDLRDSSALGQDADNVWFLQPTGAVGESHVIERTLVVAKQRNGPRLEIDFTHDERTGRFEEAGYKEAGQEVVPPPAH